MYDGGGFCDECVTELQEQCVQDDVRLASHAAELARTAGAASEGEVPVWTTEMMLSSGWTTKRLRTSRRFSTQMKQSLQSLEGRERERA